MNQKNQSGKVGRSKMNTFCFIGNIFLFVVLIIELIAMVILTIYIIWDLGGGIKSQNVSKLKYKK